MSSSADNGFEDPLENYDPVKYDDPLEQALAEEKATAVQSQPYASVSQDTPVAEAIQKLAGGDIACLLVEDEGKLVGVFSDRDILNRVALEYDQVKDSPVKEVMTTDPVYVYDTDSTSATLAVMAVTGYRHVPIVDLDCSIVGIVSPQRVTRFLRDHFQED